MTPAEVIAYLLERELLTARDLVQGDVRVHDRSSRHRGFMVSCTTRAGYFVKHAAEGDVLGTLDSEAAFYHRVNSDGPLAALRAHVPA